MNMNLDKSYHNPMLNERTDMDMARAYLKAILAPDSVFEIRVLNTRRGGPNRLWANTYSGFFVADDAGIEVALSWIGKYTGADTAGVYVTINPLKDYVLNWNHNIIAKSVASASDDDVESVQALFLDVDPVRPRLTCSTEEEHELAKARGNQIARFLIDDLGFPMPLVAGSSGSGASAIYRIPNVESSVVERCLAALHSRFSDDRVTIDATVHNPARIARVFGTINAKSPTPQPDRPWRRAAGRVLDSRPVTMDQIQALAALAPPEPKVERVESGDYNGTTYDIPELLRKANIDFVEKSRTYGTVYDLRQCLTSTEHETGASFIQFDSGAVAYRCLHNSCLGKGWQDVKGQLGIHSTASATIRIGGKSPVFTPIRVENGRVAS